jgi:hypothetical protein
LHSEPSLLAVLRAVSETRKTQYLNGGYELTARQFRDFWRGLGFRGGHTSRRERNPAGVVVHFAVLEPALVSRIVQS